MANSWGDDWGLDGYFWYAMGDSEFDKNGIAGLPDIP